MAPLATGVCTIAAEQAGDGEYEPALSATQSYAVAAAAPSVGTPAGGSPAEGGPVGEVLSLHESATPFTAPDAAPARGPVGVAARRGDHPLARRLAGRDPEVADDLHPPGAVPPHTTSCARRACASPREHAGGRGHLQLTVHPSRAALKLLRDRHTLHVQALITVTTASGTVVRLRVTVLVRPVSSR